MTIPSAKWSRLTASVRLYRSSQAVSVIGQKAYIFGGELVPREPIDNKVDVVNIDGEIGVQTIPAPQEAPIPRVGSPSTAIDGSFWIFSGRGGLEMRPVEENGALWCYNGSEAVWRLVKPADSAAPFPAGRSYHCIASDGRNKIYVHAGCPEAGRLADLWSFDIDTRSWTELAQGPSPPRGGTSIAYLDGKIYRMNGFDGKTEQGGALDIFDVAKGAWSTVLYKPDSVEGPEARSVAALLPISAQGKQYLVTMFGERDPSSLGHAGAGKMLSDSWIWDSEEARWHKLELTGDVPESRGWFDADVVKDENGSDAIIVHGGLNEENKRLGDVWKLTFE